MAKNKNKTKDVFEQDEVLQAVIIADSFNSRFDPISKKLPRCLLPLANVPLLHYTFCQLIASGIQEIIIFCCSHAAKIRKFIENQGYSDQVEVKIVMADAAQSLGDAMRDIDSRRIIQSDFILLSGDLVCNLDFKTLLQVHKARRIHDHNAIMTLPMMVNPHYLNNKKDCDLVIGYLPHKDNKLIQLSHMNSDTLRTDVGALIDEIQLRTDLVDVGVSVCSINIPPLFQDNFDYDTVEDLVTGVITNEEILNSSIHVLPLTNNVAERITTMHQYELVTRLVLSRSVAPWHPDRLSDVRPVGGLPGPTTVYMGYQSVVPRSTHCGPQVLVGNRTAIGESCELNQCVIGENCRIGSNVKLNHCFLWDNVVVEDNCQINRSLLCSNVTVKNNSKVNDRSVLCSNVIIGPKACVQSSTVLVSDKGDLLSEDIVGIEAKVFLHNVKKSIVSNTDDDDENKSDFGSESDEEVDDYQFIWSSQPTRREIRSIGDLGIKIEGMTLSESGKKSEDMKFDTDDNEEDPEALFLEEVVNTLERGLKEKIHANNIILEINSLKHAYNIPIEDVFFIVSKAIVGFPLKSKSMPCSTPTEYFSCFSKIVTAFSAVLENYLRSDEGKRFCMQAIEEAACEHNIILDTIVKMVHLLYDQDILSEDVIMWWNTDSPLLCDKDLASETKMVRAKIAPFINWLKEAEEESD